MRELDLLLGPFADAEIHRLSDAELADFELLLEVPDRDFFSWLTAEAQPPGPHNALLVAKIRAFHSHAGPIHL